MPTSQSNLLHPKSIPLFKLRNISNVSNRMIGQLRQDFDSLELLIIFLYSANQNDYIIPESYHDYDRDLSVRIC